MKWLPPRLAAVASLALSVSLAIPASGETSVPNKPDDGLMTRDSLTDTTTPPRAPAPAPTRARRHTQRTRLDSKDFLSVHHAEPHHRSPRKRAQVAAAAPSPKPRNPVVSFVYWWNGLVVRNFHTKVGTVMLGTIGAKS